MQISLKYLNLDIKVFEDTQNSLPEFLSASDALNEAHTAAIVDTTQTTADKLRDVSQAQIEAHVTKARAAEDRTSKVHNLEIILHAAKNER